MMLKVHRAAILELGRSTYTLEECHSWAHGLALHGYKSAMAGGEYFIVAVSDSEVIGFCSFESNEILGLFIAPANARRGVATQLLRQAEEQILANGADEMQRDLTIGTAREVIDQIKRYEDLGYDEYAFWIDSGMDFERKRASLSRFIDDVMPAFA
jgi:GNAT superfamily N-acetyltransferase